MLVKFQHRQPHTPSEKRQMLSHQVALATTYSKRNVVSLIKSPIRSRKVAKLDEALVGKESGKSESFTVMVKIAVQTLPHSKESRLPHWCFCYEKFVKIY